MNILQKSNDKRRVNKIQALIKKCNTKRQQKQSEKSIHEMLDLHLDFYRG